MKIVILSGSPRRGGNTHQLVQAFMEGAAAKGHRAVHFDTASMEIAPCSACCYCRGENPRHCRLEDDMARIYTAMEEAELLVLATPLYYFGFSAQIKAAIDRLFAINESLKRKGKDAGAGGVRGMALLAVCGDDEEAAMGGLVENFRIICSYLGMENAGEVLACGVYDKGDIEGHAALQTAREFFKTTL
ncbi:MAG: flavodoxin family protein [Clostridiales bacterium]|nr:flavodoxin family protein [Clostridiales bacterium]